MSDELRDEYTPTTDEVIRGYRLPHRVVEPQRSGESMAEWLGRCSVESHGIQLESEAAARRWLASEVAAAKAEASNQNARQAIECSNARFDLLNQSRKERAAVEPEWGLSDSTLDTFPEPHFTSREANVRRQQRKGHPAIKVVRRGVTPWLPVEPVQVDPQPHGFVPCDLTADCPATKHSEGCWRGKWIDPQPHGPGICPDGDGYSCIGNEPHDSTQVTEGGTQ